MTKSSVMINLDDERAGKIAEVIGNKTCKKILSILAEEELSEGDISKRLGLPLNTIGYNIKKLVSSGLIERSSNFFWSTKGKRIPTYKVSEKRIIISPITRFKGILPAILATGALAIGIKMIYRGSDYLANTPDLRNSVSGASLETMQKSEAIGGQIYQVLANAPNSWLWFLLGGLCAIFIFLLWNWRKR